MFKTMNRDAFRLLRAVLPVLGLAACQHPASEWPTQSIVEWPEQHLIFVADSRLGTVQSFQIANGAPVPYAQTHDPQRTSVRALQLDKSRGRLWVLGNHGVFIHKARGLVLQKYIAFDSAAITALRIDHARVWLLDASGTALGFIDPATLVAHRIPEEEPG